MDARTWTCERGYGPGPDDAFEPTPEDIEAYEMQMADGDRLWCCACEKHVDPEAEMTWHGYESVCPCCGKLMDQEN